MSVFAMCVHVLAPIQESLSVLWMCREYIHHSLVSRFVKKPMPCKWLQTAY